MEKILTQFAATEAKADLFSSLGIDWKMLILQTIAFLILLVILRKWVYPPLVAMLDKREKDLLAADKAAKSARENADKAEKMTNELMRKARGEANEIVAAAREEAAKLAEIQARIGKLDAEALNRKLEAMYAAMQAAGIAVQQPGIAQAADLAMQSAGWQDATPQQPGTGFAQAQGTPQPMPQGNGPMPASPHVGEREGIETKEIQL